MRAISLDAGMSQDAVRGVLRHPTNSPTIETIQKLSKALGKPPEWLAFNIGDDAYQGTVSVPVISWVSAGAFQAADTVVDTSDFPHVEISGLPEGDWIALDVEGDSMDRISPPGSRIFVNRRDRRLVPNGCYVIATEQGEATYKRYRSSPDRFEPVSVNPAHEPIFPDGVVKIIGRVRLSMLEM